MAARWRPGASSALDAHGVAALRPLPHGVQVTAPALVEGGVAAPVAGHRPTTARKPALRGLALRLAPVIAGLAAWVLAVSQLHVADATLYGLLPIVGPWFYAGLALIAGGLVAEVLRSRSSGWILAAHLVALVVVIHATVPIASGTPEYAWVFKHLGVAAALAQNGRVVDPDDIYQQWPALFAAIAAVTRLSGVNAIDFAAWAPLAFQLANCLLLLGLFRSLTRSVRVAFLATALYECLVSWVGQDYLSPQAFAYLLWLGLMTIVLRWLRADATAVPDAARRLSRLRGWLWRDLPQASQARPRRVVAVVAAAGVFAVIVFAHQLTPYVALSGLLGLTVFGLLRPRWLVVLLAAIAGAFLASRYHIISSQFGGLFSGGDVVGNASGTASAGWHSDAQAFTARVVRVLAAVMWLTTLALVARQWRTPGRVLIPAVLAFAPFAVLAGQSYGGEAIYRVFLFSAPWCALLVASALTRLRRPRLRAAVVAVVVGGALLAGLQGLYGQVAVNVFPASDLKASTWLYDHTEPGSTFVLGAEDFPALQTADYADHRVLPLPADPAMGEAWMNTDDEAMVERWTSTLGPRPVYLVITATMTRYADYYGFPDGLAGLRADVAASPRWKLVYRNADSAIYRFDARGD
jgi:hypothetical protein